MSYFDDPRGRAGNSRIKIFTLLYKCNERNNSGSFGDIRSDNKGSGVMAHSHCTKTGPGPVQGQNRKHGNMWKSLH